ncbi:hypothetical protein L7F22_022764 [Adiantum nelumboides]|nr:hypothetical protein [Adiantum nelumboides]
MIGDWERLVVPQVFLVISSKLTQRDICALASINRFTRRLLLSHPALWKVLDLHGMNRAGERLAKAINLPHFSNVEEINLEFAQGLEDNDLQCLQKRGLQSINLNACQRITDLGLRIVARSSLGLKHFSIYWNLKNDSWKKELKMAGQAEEIALLNAQVAEMSAVFALPQVKDFLKTLAKGKEKGQDQGKEHDVNAHAVTEEGEPSKKPWDEDIPELSSPSYSPPTSFSYSSDSSSSSNP